MIKIESFDKLTGTTLGNYRLERFIGQSKVGPAFFVRADATTTYLLRFLTGPNDVAPKDHEVYLEHFQFQASQITAMQHPYILPLLDFGVYRGLPYLISPHIPLRSLRTRVEKNGALNTFTVGRYLDQIATALEYAHEHAVLHGSLSVDSIFIRLDGQLVVTDIGVRGLLELNRQDPTRTQVFDESEGCAPEQLLGKPVSSATDVYALGVVVYHLLTGSTVFEGGTREEFVQQHLYASIPPMNEWRSDLPPGLYSILARAMAKNPSQRYHQPGAFANAYHDNVVQTNRTRMPFVVSSPPASAGPDYQITGAGGSPADAQFTERTWSNNGPNGTAAASRLAAPPGSMTRPSIPHSMHGFSNDEPLSLNGNERPALMRRLGRKKNRRLFIIAALLALMVIASSAIGITLLIQKSYAMSGGSGEAVFFANQDAATGQTNTLRISIQNLMAPPSGNEYDGWLINQTTEQIVNLGKLTENGQTWSLTYSGASSNLLDVEDKLEITQEQGVVQVPTGEVILSGTYPQMAFQHVEHLLVSYPDTPGKVGFLVGALEQTQLLNIQASVLQSLSTHPNTVGIECVAQNMLDIIEGMHGANYQPLTATCKGQNVAQAGDGYGVLGKNGYVASAEEHASFALGKPDATNLMRQHAALMDVALANITGWLATIEQDLLNLRAHPTDLSSIPEIATLADDAYHGMDANGDGQIDPVAGEAGAITAFQQGQLMATLTFKPGA